jgi:hypothetical protein
MSVVATAQIRDPRRVDRNIATPIRQRPMAPPLLRSNPAAEPAAIRQLDPAARRVGTIVSPADRERSAPTPRFQEPSADGSPSAASTAALSLRGGAVATGLGGFYDYQSNGGSLSYLYVRPGEWDRIYTTYMNSLQGDNADVVSSSRKVGYAYSSNGGANWVANRAITDTRLGFPSLTVSSEGLPLIAVHGDAGLGDQSFIFSTAAANEVSNFFPIAELPVAAASGKNSGVIWPQIMLSKDDSHAIVIGSYNNDVDAKEPLAPLQVVSLDINSGSTPPRWSVLTDSLSSLTSGGRAVIARSAGGKIGAAWYRIARDTEDTEFGIYYSESRNNGESWSAATPVLVGEIPIEGLDINGDVDTLSAGANLDMAYLGEEPQIVFTGNMNGLLQFANILHWSPSKNLKMVTISHQVPGLGAFGIPLDHRQSNMGSLAYPTISVGDDNQHIVIAFSAVSQTLNETGDTIISVISDKDYLYYRTWGVGSPDGGSTWGKPFVIQDFAGGGGDSASIEYPVANEVSRMNNGNFEMPMTFQARRYPGLYTGMQDDQLAGPITETLQYFQKVTVTPSMFLNISSTRSAPVAPAAEKFSVKLLPNVTSGPTEVVLSLPSTGKVDVHLYSLLGEQVYQTTRSGLAGVDRIPLDLHSVPPGTYHCSIVQNGYTASTQVVVAR